MKNYAGTLNIMTMVYDALGNKTKKTTYLSDGVTVEKVTVYIREASGSTFTVFEAGQSSPFVGTEVMLEGGSLGVFFPASSTNNYIYSLSDHLSNTRVTIGRDKIGSSAVVLSYSDYYAWGMSMPGREFTTSPKFRLGYQGQEFEASVKMYGFALRMYDQRLSRWHATDPYEQHWSPYLAMSNNPISFVDPDGGWDGGPTGMDPAHNNYLGFGDKTNLQGTTVTATRLNPFFLFDGRPSSAYLFPGYASIGNVSYDINKVMAASIEIVRSELANVGAGNKSYALNVYFSMHNDNNYLSEKDRDRVFSEINNIYSKKGNDLDDIFNFIIVDENDLDKIQIGRHDLFFGIVNSPALVPGNSEIASNGQVQSHYYQKNDGKLAFRTYVNYYHASDDFPSDPVFGLSYLAAHELLHQLIIKALYNLEGESAARAAKSLDDGHTNSEINLNMEGPKIQARNAYPQKSSSKLRPAEKILPEHRNKIFLYLFENFLKK